MSLAGQHPWMYRKIVHWISTNGMYRYMCFMCIIVYVYIYIYTHINYMYMDKLQQRPHCDVTGMTVSRGNYPKNVLISSIFKFMNIMIYPDVCI